MTISALRDVAGKYLAAKQKGEPATRPFQFRRPMAVFLVGKRGRDAGFRRDGKLSIWTVSGRKHIDYAIPAHYQEAFSAAIEVDSLRITERDGKLRASLTITIAVPKPTGASPVGVDINETNALVAIDADGRELFISGKSRKVLNTRTRKTRARLQRKLAARKAENRDTRAARRILKRLSRKQSNRTKTFCQTAARRLIDWVPQDALIVLEDLALPKQNRQDRKKRGVRRRLSTFPYALLRRSVEQKAEEHGITVAAVNPSYTSQTCSRCA